MALLVWFLSKQPSLAAVYIATRRREYDLNGYALSDERSCTCLLASWFLDDQVRRSVFAGLSDPNHPVRAVADAFLMTTLTVEYIVHQNEKGLTVDLQHAITHYLRTWSLRPTTPGQGRALARMAWHRHTRRRFGQQLRREFGLTLTRYDCPRDLLRDQICRKASVVIVLCRL